MAKTLANVQIYGDAASGAWVGAFGGTPTLPTTLATPGAGFTEIGWISEDGITPGRARAAQTFNAWQGGAVMAKRVTSVDDTFKFQALEENLTTVGLYYRGVTGVVTSGIVKFTIANQTRADVRAWVFDFVNGAVTKRIVVPTGEVTDTADIPHNNANMSLYDMTVTAYGDYFIYSNAPALIV